MVIKALCQGQMVNDWGADIWARVMCTWAHFCKLKQEQNTFANINTVKALMEFAK